MRCYLIEKPARIDLVVFSSRDPRSLAHETDLTSIERLLHFPCAARRVYGEGQPSRTVDFNELEHVRAGVYELANRSEVR